MTPVTFAIIGYIVASIHIVNRLEAWFNQLHAYVIKKGWL